MKQTKDFEKIIDAIIQRNEKKFSYIDYPIALIKNEKVVKAVWELEEDDCSLIVFIEDANEDNKFLKKLQKEYFSYKPNLQFESIVFVCTDKDIVDKKVESTICNVLEHLKDHCNNCKLISIGKYRDENSSDDVIFYYNNEIKQAAEAVRKSAPNSKVVLLNLEADKDIIGAVTLNGIEKNNLMISEDKVELAKDKIKQIAKLIKSKTDSPFEQHLLALHYISQYVYTLDDENQPLSASRSLSEIISNNAKYICCAGYARYYTEVMRAIGFEAKTQSAKDHLRAKILMQDKKYNISGVYLVEPTWLSRKENEKLPIFRFNKYCNMSIKTIIDAYKRERRSDYIGEGIHDYYKRNALSLKQLKSDLTNRTFTSGKDVGDFLDAERLEKREDIYSIVWNELIDIVNDDTKSQIDGKYLVELLDKSDIDWYVKIDERLDDYLKISKKERQKQMSAFLKRAYPRYTRKSFEDSYDVCSYLYWDAVEAGLPEKIANQAFNMNFLLPDSHISVEHDKKYIDTHKRRVFKGICKDAKTIAKRVDITLSNPRKYESDSKEIRSLVGTLSGSKEKLDILKTNFTRLGDEEFSKILESTTEVKDETLRKAVEHIKTLIKPEDYDMFLQDNSKFGKHEDTANKISKEGRLK